jgi:hypothetical protein
MLSSKSLANFMVDLSKCKGGSRELRYTSKYKGWSSNREGVRRVDRALLLLLCFPPKEAKNTKEITDRLLAKNENGFWKIELF